MDDADRAGIEIESELQGAIDAWRAHAHPRIEARLSRDGLRLCLGCGEPIQARRLAALPGAVRCVACQADAERGRA